MTPFDDPEILHEFIAEATEVLAALDRSLSQLEAVPDDDSVGDSVFRGFHNLRGTCGWMALARMEALALAGQDLVEQVRDAGRPFTLAHIRLLLSAVDALRRCVRHLERHGQEPADDLSELIARVTAGATISHVETPTEREATDRDEAADRSMVSASAGSTAGELTGHLQARVSGAGLPDEPGAPLAPAVGGASVRVDVDLLDQLMNQVGELVLVRNQLALVTERAPSRELTYLGQRLHSVTAALQESVMKTRMQAVRQVWRGFPRLVRDLSLDLGKQVRLQMTGADTELDRTLVEAIQAPLIHLLRNAVDHGIEAPAERMSAGKPAEGTIHLRAYHEGGQVIITVTDDGRGIDVEELRRKALSRGAMSRAQLEGASDTELLELIFQPGFSTAAAITHVSGRGVGMDVVRRDIESIGGAVDIFNQAERGLSFKIRIPLTLAIIPALIVRVGGVRYAIPQASLVELIWLETRADIVQVYDAPVFRTRGTLLPLLFANEILQVDAEGASDHIYIVVLEAEGRRFGLVVDHVLDTKEIVVKPLGVELRGLACYAGATILGDGRVALILDAAGLAQRAGLGDEAPGVPTPPPVLDPSPVERMLLFQVGHSRLAMHLADVARLEEVRPSDVEHIGEQQFLQYRQDILPLLHVSRMVPERRRQPRSADEPAPGASDVLRVIVHDHGTTRMGLVVDAILDVVETPLDVQMGATRPGVSSTAIIDGRITELLDLERARQLVHGRQDTPS